MPNEAEKRLRDIAGIVRREASRARDLAGHSGEHGDRGASAMEEAAEVFIAGLEQRLPETWSSYAKMYGTKSDPEYPEYQRLKRKFSGTA